MQDDILNEIEVSLLAYLNQRDEEGEGFKERSRRVESRRGFNTIVLSIIVYSGSRKVNEGPSQKHRNKAFQPK